MLKIDIDGKQVEVPPGSTVMDAANKLGVYIPHFCYHKKLSIAANCRMCLVEIEKAPKPMPACATPATDGMKVKTQSTVAKQAQNGVMEFLLINHPLDCPICDQGGECQLQDLAVGYGKSDSRYTEEKRVVLRKELGPLVAAEEMARCIQCTRCVRFGQEIAGMMELGMIGRGEKSEIVAFVGRSVDSELAGNMIDLCPVGALTSEPFRYKARNWELARRKSFSPHDGLGSNLIVQVKQHRVMRVLPFENEEINECWLSDKDRFSYEGLNRDRLAKPMIRKNGEWEEAEWQEALDTVLAGIRGKELGILASPHSTLEELFLAGRLAAATGGAADFRLRHSDFSADGKLEGVPYLGMPIADLNKLDRVLVVGSFLRKDHPLIAQRLRQAAKHGTQVNVLHSVDDDWWMPVANKKIVPPSELVSALASINDGPIGESLRFGKNVAVLLGNFAQQHPQAAQLHAAAQALGYPLGFLGEAANSVGGYLAGLPVGGNANTALEKKALLALGAEPELDCADPQSALAAMQRAEMVVVMTPFRAAYEYADVLLPITPFTETGGTFVNTEGRAQTFHAAVRPLGEARPGWKVLRVLGTLLEAPGFELDTIDEVRAACVDRDDLPALSNKTQVELERNPVSVSGIQRIADVPIYFADPLVRRSPPLQKTRDAQPPRACMNARLLQKLGVAEGQPVLVKQGEGSAKLMAALDDRLPDDCVRVSAAHPSTASLGPMFGAVTLEKLALQQAA